MRIHERVTGHGRTASCSARLLHRRRRKLTHMRVVELPAFFDHLCGRIYPGPPSPVALRLEHALAASYLRFLNRTSGKLEPHA